ncbi:hypothetical protein [Scytonema sp. PRP1]|uniref:hypothetical protein n=1 Tax=Scytonema sp. PRP1 TaxID=3120513 RepID=UPI003FA6FC9B
MSVITVEVMYAAKDSWARSLCVGSCSHKFLPAQARTVRVLKVKTFVKVKIGEI